MMNTKEGMIRDVALAFFNERHETFKKLCVIARDEGKAKYWCKDQVKQL